MQVVIAAVGDKDSTYADLVGSFPDNDCRYGGLPLPGMRADLLSSYW